MLTRLIVKFDEHCIRYFAIIGCVISFFNSVPGRDPISNAVMHAVGLALAGGIFWYPCKALCITCNTIANWKETHPGEPMVKWGAITEYDRSFAEAVGQAAGEAAAAAVKRNASEGTEE